MNYFITKKGRIITISVTLLLVIISTISAFFVKTNYDMTKYLDVNSNTYQGIQLMQDHFGEISQAEVMATGDIADAIEFKTYIKTLDYVQTAVFIDDYVDLSLVPIEFVPEDIKANFIQDENYKILVTFSLNAYDTRIDETLISIETYGDVYLRGEIIDNQHAREVANSQLIVIMAIIVPVCILVLVLFTASLIEVLIVLVVLGVGILLNLGTNLFIGEVSFITMTMAMALQLAMSFDYSLFFLHRLHEYEDLGKEASIKKALKLSFKSITASSLTTIFGFIALMFMQYKIGLDIGLVLSKGILFSYLSVILVMPVLVYVLFPLLLKTKHKVLLPKFKGLAKWIEKRKLILGIFFLLFVIGGLLLQSETAYSYQTHTSSPGSRVYDDNEIITQKFGPNNPYIILFKDSTVSKDLSLISDLSQMPEVLSIQALVTTVDPNTPRELIPSSVIKPFIQGDYSRIILNLSLVEENSAYYELDTKIRETAKTYYTEAYYIGLMPSTSDIRTMVLEDSLLIMMLSIVLVGLVVGLVFKSLFLPILLLIIIESSIWMNVGLNSLTDSKVLFIGYLIVMSIQLGATIDYAVLMSSRYIENRTSLSKKDALIEAISKSLPTILISAIILSLAGFVEYLVSDMEAIKAIGLLLSRGTIFAFLVTLLFLPPYLYYGDRLFIKRK
ncbi:MAG: MMPL family transporter [Acholeplasma sp.]|nr:MMPL family transporter [Acholeplasma sp.]